MPTGVAFTIASKNSCRNRWPRDHLAADGFGQRLRLLSAPRTYANRGPRLRERESTARAAPRRPQSARGWLEARSAAPARAARRHNPCCTRRAFRPRAPPQYSRLQSCRERIAAIEVFQDAFLVRKRDAEASNPERLDGVEKILQVAHQKRQINRVHPARLKSRILHHGREGMANRIADHAIDAGLAGQCGRLGRRVSFPRARSGPAPWRSRPAHR